MIRSAALAFIVAAVILPAHAQGVSTDASLAPAGTYAADTAHTRISWQLSHFGTSTYTGWFKSFEISLTFDPNAPEKSKLTASVDPTSVSTLDPKFDEEIASAKFLDAAKFPAVTFTAATITKTGETTGTMTGDLTFHGVTKPVTFNVTFHGGTQSAMKNAYVLGFGATATIKRSEFGVIEYIDFGLGDDVTIGIEGEFIHQE
ncbi:Protein YceI [Alphaproteobacteria bacterium SO-S41]|nr:Protein YceI [Alphaproteobacteria bacterium SO-S41]